MPTMCYPRKEYSVVPDHSNSYRVVQHFVDKPTRNIAIFYNYTDHDGKKRADKLCDELNKLSDW